MTKQTLEKLTDSDLVAQAKKRDYYAFEELMKRYEKGIYNLALRFTRNPQEAEEILQDTLLSVFKNLKNFREESSFKTWIYKVATNFSLMNLRKRKQTSRIFLDEPLQFHNEELPREIADWSKNPEDMYEKQELKRILKKAVDTLPDMYQTVFWLRDVDGLANQEVADILGLTLPAVKSRILRARILLRDYLSEYFKDGQRGK